MIVKTKENRKLLILILLILTNIFFLFLVACQGEGKLEETTPLDSHGDILDGSSTFGPTKESEQEISPDENIAQKNTAYPIWRNIHGNTLDEIDFFDLKFSTGGNLQLIAMSPEGELFGVTADDNVIYKIEDNGENSIYLTSQENIACLGFDSLGNLWFTSGSNKLYRVENDREPEIIIDSNVNRVFYFDDQNNIYAVDFWGRDKNIQKISPSGQISELAKGLDINKYAIGKNGEIVILNHSGEVHQLMENNELVYLAGGYYVDIGIGFNQDNELVIFNGIEIHSINIETGAKIDYPWFSERYSLGTNFIVFDKQGIMYGGHPNHGIYKINFEEQSVSLVFHPRGNTRAMAIDDQDNLYVAYGDELPNGQTTLYKIVGASELEAISTIPFGNAMGLAIDKAGVAYLGVRDSGNGKQKIYAIDINTGQFEEYIETKDWEHINSISIDPISGTVWWSIRGRKVYYRDNSGAIQNISVPENTDEINLHFGPDGILYATITERRETPTSSPHKKSLYKLDENKKWQQIVDLTTHDPTLWLVIPVVCPNGNRYILQSIDANTYGKHPKHNTFNAVIRLEKDYSLSLLGYDFSYDAQAVVCDSSSHLLFTSGIGIYRFMDY